MATNGRLRDYLTLAEVRTLLCAAKSGRRYAARNFAMILLAYRHGFRASELVELRVGDVDLRAGTIYCRRRKGSKSSVHPMKRDEIASTVDAEKTVECYVKAGTRRKLNRDLSTTLCGARKIEK